MQEYSIQTERTLCFLIRDSQIFLAKQKRGHGADNYNGYGGKFEKEKGDNTIEDTAVRETWEESGNKVHIDKKDLNLRAIIEFYFPYKPELSQRVHVYFVGKWRGEPSESDEAHAGVWFSMNALPSNMWDSDKYWLPYLMDGKKIKATFYWKEDNKTVDTHSIVEVDTFD